MPLDINKIVDEVFQEMEEATTLIATTTGDTSSATSDQKKQAAQAAAKGDSVKIVKKGDPNAIKENLKQFEHEILNTDWMQDIVEDMIKFKSKKITVEQLKKNYESYLKQYDGYPTPKVADLISYVSDNFNDLKKNYDSVYSNYSDPKHFSANESKNIKESPYTGKMLTAKQVNAIAKKAGSIVSDAEADINALAVEYGDKTPAQEVKNVLAEYDIDLEDLKKVDAQKSDGGTISIDQLAAKGLLEEKDGEMVEPEDEDKGSISSKACAAIDEAIATLAGLGESEDKKAKKSSDKVIAVLNKAKTALEALTAHENKLAEAEAETNRKAEEKAVNAVRKLITKKRSKDPALADKLSRDYDKVIRKLKDQDPDKVEEAIFNHFLKEAAQSDLVKKKSLTEGKIANIIAGIATALGTLGITGGMINAINKEPQEREARARYLSSIDSLEKKLDIHLIDSEDTKKPAAWKIDPKDFEKIDSIYNDVVSKYPKYEQDENNKIYDYIRGVKPKDKGYQSMQSLDRALKLGTILKSAQDKPELLKLDK